MAQPNDPVASYDEQAPVLAQRYESVSASDIHAILLTSFPTSRASHSTWAGSGRDAVSLGHEVVAVEPAAGMRGEGKARHPDDRIRWLDDRLPALIKTHRLGLSFDVILANPVWMHVAPADRQRAFRKLVTLLKPGGLLIASSVLRPPKARNCRIDG